MRVLDFDAERNRRSNGAALHEPFDAHGVGGNPRALRRERLQPIRGYPIVLPGTFVVISGRKGGGRSMLAQACAYDGARAGVRTMYFGSEVLLDEFDERTRRLAETRGDSLSEPVDERLRSDLDRGLRYVDLASAVQLGWRDQAAYVAAYCSYDAIVIDPLAVAAATLGLRFDDEDAFNAFYTRLVLPLTRNGTAVVALDNTGHTASDRPAGSHAKGDRADLEFSCRSNPRYLTVTAQKVRSINGPFASGDRWVIRKDSQRLEPATGPAPETVADESATVDLQAIYDAVASKHGITVRALIKAVRANAAGVGRGVAQLVDDGYIRREQVGQALRHYPLRPYRESSETTR